MKLDDKAIKKIRLIDEIRQLLNLSGIQDIKLPQIIVVGDQSSGKSSVLEAISNIELPRGSGTVTICPLVIQMQKSNEDKKIVTFRNKSWPSVDTSKDIKRIQSNDLKNEITDEPIILERKLPDICDLTIIDLPGLVQTKSESHGDGIVEKTKEISKFYMLQKNSLILCVLKATSEVCTAIAIQLAKEANEDHSRIIGVLTNIDRIDDEDMQRVTETLENKNVILKKGYFAVNVSSTYLTCKKEAREEVENEIKRKFPSCKERIGIDALITTLQKELNTIIDENLPWLKEKIQTKLKECEEEINKHDSIYDNKELQRRETITLASQIQDMLNNILVPGKGKLQDYKDIFLANSIIKKENVNSTCTFLYCWHLIFNDLHFEVERIFKDLFIIKTAIYKAKDIWKLMQMGRTEDIHMFYNSDIFNYIVIDFLKRIKEVIIAKLKSIIELTESVIHMYFKRSDKWKKYNNLMRDMMDLCLRTFDNQKKIMFQHIDFIFESEETPYLPDSFLDEFEKSLMENEPKQQQQQQVQVQQQGQQQVHQPQKQQEYAFSDHNPISNIINGPMKNANSKEISYSPFKPSKTYSNAERIEALLEYYIKNLIRRISIVIPTSIKNGLFKHYVKQVTADLTNFVSKDSIFEYFKISEELENHLKSLKMSADNLRKCLNEINKYELH